jgi:hypothetical protein
MDRILSLISRYHPRFLPEDDLGGIKDIERTLPGSGRGRFDQEEKSH